MKAPAFWERKGSLPGALLAPLGWAYAGATAWRLRHGQLWRAPVPVVCIGNLTAGGAGKTPVVRDLARRLAARDSRPAILSRGYGGQDSGPLQVDPARHGADRVGDEPLLLARDAPCWIARDRAQGARAAVASGAGIILMDDGLQNPDLAQDLKLIVVDGAAGFGNGRAIPAGPLRERVDAGIARADALIVVGDDAHGLAERLSGRIAMLRAALVVPAAAALAGKRCLAFAGIGRPAKFRASLLEAGADIAGFHAFADHHPYREPELAALAAEAAALEAELITTEKDWVRLAPAWRETIRPIPISLVWRDTQALAALLDRMAHHG